MDLRLIKRIDSRVGASCLVAGAMVLAGCISPPKSQMDKLSVEAPSAWASESTAGDFQPMQWMADFNDPMLESILREALEHNYNLQAAEARLESQIAGTVVAQSGIWPTLNATTGVSESRSSSADGLQRARNLNKNYSLNGRFNWEIDLWGRVRNGYRGDLADAESSMAEYRATRLSIAGRTAKAWYAAIEASQQHELAHQTLESIRSSSEIVEENFKRGIARALDVRLLRANVASNESTLETRLRARDAAIRNLETLLGRYPAKELKIASELPEIKGSVPAGLPTDLLLRRPDVLAAERDLAALEQRKFEAKKAFLPNISTTLSRGTRVGEREDLFELMDFRTWSKRLDVSVPVFQGRRLSASAKRAKANYEQSLADFANTALTAFREVENALANQDSFARDYEFQKVARDESVAAEELAWEQYGRGLSDITTALDAVRRSISAQRSFIQVSNQRIQGRIDLYLALGGGFDFESETDN
ncbi:MAG: TolC family protein [Verrucomicrobiota bacterium]